MENKPLPHSNGPTDSDPTAFQPQLFGSQWYGYLFFEVTSRDNNTYCAIGTELPVTAALCATARAIWLLDTDAHQRLGASQWTLNHWHFDMTIFITSPKLNTTFPAQHAYQKLFILMFNQIHASKPNIAQRTFSLSTRPIVTQDSLCPIVTQDSLVQLISDSTTFPFNKTFSPRKSSPGRRTPPFFSRSWTVFNCLPA